MQRRFWAASLVVALAAFSLSLAGCGQLNKLKAKKAYKEANMLYQQQDYKRAAERYEEVAANDDTLTGVYFFLGNSYDNLYKPSRKGEAQNDAYLTKAVQAYKKGVEVEKDKTLKTRCLQYLVAAYGTDKLNDPAQAEPLLAVKSLAEYTDAPLSLTTTTMRLLPLVRARYVPKGRLRLAHVKSFWLKI